MPTYIPLQSVTLSSVSSSILFSNIPQNYNDLIVVMNARVESGNGNFFAFKYNGSSTPYSWIYMLGSGSGLLGARASDTAAGNLGNLSTDAFYTNTVYINDYSNTSIFKTGVSRTNSSVYVGTYASMWRSLNAINSIEIYNDALANFSIGSTFSLYALSTASANNTQASGGTEIYYDSSYAYHVFKDSGTFTPNRNLTADILVVASGGGGANAGIGGNGCAILTFTLPP